MKRVISASRRTDLTAFFPEWLSAVLKEEKAQVLGPSGRIYEVDLRPDAVHTIVLWSKNFTNLIAVASNLPKILQKYDQLYLHFTITGLGGIYIESGAVAPDLAAAQLDQLIVIVGLPERISVRFDPIIYWQENGEIRTNLRYFEELAPELSRRGIRSVHISFCQWYGKARRRAEKKKFSFFDPKEAEKKIDAAYLVDVARVHKLKLFSCSQDFVSDVAGISPSSCINGPLLQSLHPHKEDVSIKKDRSQRKECRCTESVDIGSYTQACPHGCLYCYANPKLG